MKKLPSRRSWMRERKLQKPLRDLEKFTDLGQPLMDEQRRKVAAGAARYLSKGDMISCREHQRMQKRSQFIAKSAGKKKRSQKDAGECDGEVEQIRDGIAERDARSRALCPVPPCPRAPVPPCPRAPVPPYPLTPLLPYSLTPLPPYPLPPYSLTPYLYLF